LYFGRRLDFVRPYTEDFARLSPPRGSQSLTQFPLPHAWEHLTSRPPLETCIPSRSGWSASFPVHSAVGKHTGLIGRNTGVDVGKQSSKGFPSADRSQYTFASRARAVFEAHNLTPRKVPNVLVIRSVVPEPRVGRYDCRISIVRLTISPTATVVKPACLIGRADDQ
jgi:hypothetical protein